MSDKKELSFNAGWIIISIALILSAGVLAGNITVYDALWFLFSVLIITVGLPLAIIGILMLWARY